MVSAHHAGFGHEPGGLTDRACRSERTRLLISVHSASKLRAWNEWSEMYLAERLHGRKLRDHTQVDEIRSQIHQNDRAEDPSSVRQKEEGNVRGAFAYQGDRSLACQCSKYAL